MVQPLWKTVWQSCTKLSLLFPYDLVIVLFGTCPNELKSYVHTQTYKQRFTAFLLKIAKAWMQLTHPLAGELMNKFWYIQTMDHDSALK